MKIITMKNSKVLLVGIGLVAVLSYISFFGYNIKSDYPEIIENVVNKSPTMVSGFKLIDHNEKVVTSDRFTNNWTFVFFGFTNCPDVCPATLSQLVRLNKLLSSDVKYSKEPQFFFVSVDPERDSISHIAGYIKYFDRGFTGMTGTTHDIASIEKQFNAFHDLGKKNEQGDYSVAHSATIFLVDPDGRHIANFEPPMDITLVKKQFELFVQRYNKSLSLT